MEGCDHLEVRSLGKEIERHRPYQTVSGLGEQLSVASERRRVAADVGDPRRREGGEGAHRVRGPRARRIEQDDVHKVGERTNDGGSVARDELDGESRLVRAPAQQRQRRACILDRGDLLPSSQQRQRQRAAAAEQLQHALGIADCPERLALQRWKH